MTEYLIGTGGWAYFHVRGLNPLAAYSRAFNFVEVNSTFYTLPSIEEVENWRKLVPTDFQFSVRAHRSITHKNKLTPTNEALEIFGKMKQVCSLLRADILHLQTPASVKPTADLAKTLKDFLKGAEPGKLRMALEMRGASSARLPPEVVRVMEEHDVVHSVDLTKGEEPAYKSDVLYSRLFGKGHHNVYQPTDEELNGIHKKAITGNYRKVVFSFHFVSMYKDAARLKVYTQTGKFPMITRSTGLASLEEVLSVDAKFPTTKHELVKHQGWKLFDSDRDKRVRAAEFLQKLPERTYNDIGDVMTTLKTVTGAVQLG